MEVTLRLRNGRAAGEIGKLSVRSQSLVRDLSVTGGAISMTRDGVHGFLTVARDGSGATARCGDGNRIERIELNGSEARLLARRDFQILETAIDQLANDTRAGKTDVLESRPLRPSVVREALYEKLGIVHNKP